MQTRQRFSFSNVWKLGNVVGDRHNMFLITKDNSSENYRLVDIETGIIMTEEYSSLEELRDDNSDLDPLLHSEFIYE